MEAGGRQFFALARPLQEMEAPENAPAVQRHIELMRIAVFNGEPTFPGLIGKCLAKQIFIGLVSVGHFLDPPLKQDGSAFPMLCAWR